MNFFAAGPLRNACLAALALLALGQRLACANPDFTTATISQGGANFTPSGSTLTINAANNTFINWKSFDINPGETTTFIQPSSSSVVWNYINNPDSPSASSINGTLNANGFVVLQNPNGFTVGGQAAITAHGLIMTTASPAATPDLSSGGPWSFNTPPPTIPIINYGKIKITGGGPAFLIADEIENKNGGSISAQSGQVGLYAGQKVLISTSPDGRGLSVKATVPSGGVVNIQGQLTADAGSIVLNAQTVNQNGFIQANSVQNVNGTIELVAGNPASASDPVNTSAAVNLGANSLISANGDSTASTPNAGGLVTIQSGNTITLDSGSEMDADAGRIALSANTVNVNGKLRANSIRSDNGAVEISGTDRINLGANAVIAASGDLSAVSPGGFVVLHSGNNYADTATSQINVSGNSGGQDGIVEIFGTGTVNAQIGNHYAFFNNPYGLTLSTGATDPTIPNLNINDLRNYSQICLYDIELSSMWNLGNAGVPATLNLVAGNNIILDDAGIQGGNNWQVNLTAGTLPAVPAPGSGNDGIYLDGSAYIQTRNGDINLCAPNDITVNGGAVRTIGGGNITVTSVNGNVDTGTSTSGFNFNPFSKAPYYSPFTFTVFGGLNTSTSLGGISTAAGGNVTIKAGGDVTSFLPTSSGPLTDAGTGAFGSQPGNVTINAGGNVYGHYVVANGVGSITAGQSVGDASQNAALSLVKGGWTVDALNGDIYLQEVRNPNGVFNTTGSAGAGGHHYFDYDPMASVSLDAANGGVFLTGQNLPRPSDAVNAATPMPILLPPTLNIVAGTRGITLENDFTLFPSADGNLTINDAGDFNNGNPGGTAATLLMSDSARTRWFTPDSGPKIFSGADHGGSPIELNNYDPVVIHVSGDMSDVILQTSKATRLTVGGDMTGCSFYAQNLHPGDDLHPADVTSITVGGRISNPSSFSSPVTLDDGLPDLLQVQSAQGFSAGALLLPPGSADNWYSALNLAVNPALLPSTSLASYSLDQLKQIVSQAHLLQGVDPSSYLAYDPVTKKLIAIGPMPSSILGFMQEQTLTLVEYDPNGVPLLNPATGLLQTYTISWASSADASQLATLQQTSQSLPPLGSSGNGYVIGGTGEFDINAGSISLGNSAGILSLGNGKLVNADYSYLTSLLQNAPGATINVTLAGDLEMPISTIAALGGGNVNVISAGGSMDLGSQDLVRFEALIMSLDNLGLGIYTTGGGSVTVTAEKTINIDSSRIATFNGGDIVIESYTGDVNAGSGGSVAIPVNVFSPYADIPLQPFEQAYANGIVAETLVNASQVPGSATVPGNITVKTPQGSIYASLGGILQEALNANLASGSGANPVITLEAGTPGPGGFGSKDTPVFVGNINFGTAGAIGVNLKVEATGNITGVAISQNNSDITGQTVGNLTVLAGGTANVVAQNSGSGQGITIIGVGGVNASGLGSGVTLLGQNVSVNGGGSQSTLGTSATATSASQSAAVAAASDASQQVASSNPDDDQKKKEKHPLVQRVKRVTVILPTAS